MPDGEEDILDVLIGKAQANLAERPTYRTTRNKRTIQDAARDVVAAHIRSFDFEDRYAARLDLLTRLRTRLGNFMTSGVTGGTHLDDGLTNLCAQGIVRLIRQASRDAEHAQVS